MRYRPGLGSLLPEDCGRRGRFHQHSREPDASGQRDRQHGSERVNRRDEEGISRLRREAELLEAARHPGVVELLGFEVTDDAAVTDAVARLRAEVGLKKVPVRLGLASPRREHFALRAVPANQKTNSLVVNQGGGFQQDFQSLLHPEVAGVNGEKVILCDALSFPKFSPRGSDFTSS